MRPPSLETRGAGGCRRAVAGALALAVLAPVVAVVRAMARWRRGDDVRLSWHDEPFSAADGEARLVDVALDVPDVAGARLRRELTDTVVRFAERVRRPDDVYHLVYRVPTEPESVVVPVGASVQALAERFALALGQHDLEGRTAVWLAMPRAVHVAEVLDPFTYDPEADGEPRSLLARAPLRWALATGRRHGTVSTRLRMLVVLPAARQPLFEELLGRLRGRLRHA